MHTFQCLDFLHTFKHHALFSPFIFLVTALFVASFEADATEGLHFMHGAGIVRGDHKLHNILICRSDGPAGFVGEVTDPGVWCGESGFRSEGRLSGRKKTNTRTKSPRFQSAYSKYFTPVVVTYC